MDLEIKQQLHTAGLIERFWENTIKSGKDKLSKAFLTTRLQLLESYWTRFVEAHNSLLAHDGLSKTEY